MTSHVRLVQRRSTPTQLFVCFPATNESLCFRGPAASFPATDSASTRLWLSAKVLLCFLLIHRKAAWSLLLWHLKSVSKPKLKILQVSFPSGDQRGLKGSWGGWRKGGRKRCISPQKIPFAIFSPFCFMRGSVELATFLARTGRARPRFFSTKS